jgi:hypothetical protein
MPEREDFPDIHAGEDGPTVPTEGIDLLGNLQQVPLGSQGLA